MANKDSAKKAVRSSKKKSVFNLRRKRAMKDAMKTAREMIASGDKEGVVKLLPRLYKALDKAVKTGVIKKNTASRNKSRITRAADKLS